jgi:hypothetical protein
MQLSMSSSTKLEGAKKSKRQEEVLLNGPKALMPSLIGTSDKFPLEKKQ